MLASQATLALENVRRFEEQREVIERLADLDRMKNDFLSTVSHELRTPLTVITGMGRTLEHQWETIGDDIRTDFLARLNANAAALDHVIAQLLDFSKLERDSSARTPPRSTSPSCCPPWSNDSRHCSEHHVEVDVAPELSTHADPGLIERVVENLLSNASKYTPAGCHVVVSAEEDGPDHVIVAVGDDGPGMSKDSSQRIGERFFRGGDVHTRSTRGTGLGLAVVSEILELRGSSLEVESYVGHGSRFWFRLAKDPQVIPAPAPRPPIELPESSGNSGRVTPGGGDPPRRAVRDRHDGGGHRRRMGDRPAVSGVPPRPPPVSAGARARAIRPPRSGVWMDVAQGLRTSRETRSRSGAGCSSSRVDPSTKRAHRDPSSSRPRRWSRCRKPWPGVAALPPDHADVLLLRALGHLDVDAVAEITGQETGGVAPGDGRPPTASRRRRGQGGGGGLMVDPRCPDDGESPCARGSGPRTVAWSTWTSSCARSGPVRSRRSSGTSTRPSRRWRRSCAPLASTAS